MDERIMNKEKIRVAIVSQSMNIGGGEMMAARLATYISRDKFDLKLFIISRRIENQIAELLDKSGIVFECLGLPTSLILNPIENSQKRLENLIQILYTNI